MEWSRNPATWRLFVALLCALALVGGYFGTVWFLEQTPPQPVFAAEGTNSPIPTETPTGGPIVINGTGDVLPAAPYAPKWDGVRELFLSDDLTIVNLECTPSTVGEPEDKEFTFRCPNELEAIASSGVEVVNQGNNHSGDFGREAMMDGRARLLAAGLASVGTGHNTAEANEPAILERRGKRIAVLGFGGVLPSPSWLATDSRAGQADGYDVASMVAAVKAAAARSDLVVVVIHWGEELETKPRGDDVGRAHAMIDAGADVIFGSHAHRLQALEFYKGKPVFYGLGNFVWPKGGPTAVGQVIVPEEGPIRACLLPGYISGGRPKLTGPASC